MDRIELPLTQYTYAQKLDLLESIRDDLIGDEKKFESPAWHEAVFKDREEALAAGSVTVSDWEEAKERIRRNILCR
ncbi:MAG: addiction module protein [Candidatus Sabulitectum sp.]|nr:addiction module protein [Candidatus Sabulitectum sp.]